MQLCASFGNWLDQSIVVTGRRVGEGNLVGTIMTALVRLPKDFRMILSPLQIIEIVGTSYWSTLLYLRYLLYLPLSRSSYRQTGQPFALPYLG